MKKIVFIGPPGSGKSTLATDIFNILKKQDFNAELVDEFIRRDIQLNGPMETIWEQYRTLFKQREIEDAVPWSNDFSIIDSGTLTPFFYAQLYSNCNNKRERLVLQDMYKFLIDDLYLRRYDKIFFIPYFGKNKVDGTRYQTDREVELLNKSMMMTFTEIFTIDNIFMCDIDFNLRTKFVIDCIFQ